MDCSMPGLPVHHQYPEFTQTHVHWISDAVQLSHPLLSPSPPAFNLPASWPFQMSHFFNIRWSKYWSFSFSINPSNEYSGLISSRMDWLDLLSVQGTFKSLLQHHSSKESVLQCSAFFILIMYKRGHYRFFPLGTVAKTPLSQCKRPRFNPCSGN